MDNQLRSGSQVDSRAKSLISPSLTPSAAAIIEERLQMLLERIIIVADMSYDKLSPISERDSGMNEDSGHGSKELPPLFNRYQEIIDSIDSNLSRIRYNLERVDL